MGLLKVDPAGLTLRPLPLGSSQRLVVGEPVAAIGSPFGEPQSLSVGVISALDRTIESLTDFQISDAIQTDAAVNRATPAGRWSMRRDECWASTPRSSPPAAVARAWASPSRWTWSGARWTSCAATAGSRTPTSGSRSAAVYPQLARRLELPVQRGALLQSIQAGSPAARAGLRAGTRNLRFQARPYRAGGDVITRVDGKVIREESDLSRAIARRRAGDTVEIEYYRDGDRRSARLRLAERPLAVTRPSLSPSP